MIYFLFDQIRTPIGKVVVFLMLIWIILFFVNEHRERQEGGVSSLTARLPSLLEARTRNESIRKPVSVSNETHYRSFNPQPPKSTAAVVPTKVSFPRAVDVQQREMTPLVHFYKIGTESQGANVEPISSSEVSSIEPLSLPPGTSITCQLVNEITSGDAQSPIIGIVRGNVMVRGKVVIPYGSRVFGTTGDRSKSERIMSDPNWSIITPTGREINIQGYVMGTTRDVQEGQWGQDFSSGLAGLPHSDGSSKHFRAFIPIALGTLARWGRTGVSTLFGFQPDNSFSNLGRQFASDSSDYVSSRYIDRVQVVAPSVKANAGQGFIILIPPNLPSSRALPSLEEATLLNRRGVQSWLRTMNELRGN